MVLCPPYCPTLYFFLQHKVHTVGRDPTSWVRGEAGTSTVISFQALRNDAAKAMYRKWRVGSRSAVSLVSRLFSQNSFTSHYDANNFTPVIWKLHYGIMTSLNRQARVRCPPPIGNSFVPRSFFGASFTALHLPNCCFLFKLALRFSGPCFPASSSSFVTVKSRKRIRVGATGARHAREWKYQTKKGEWTDFVPLEFTSLHITCVS